MINESLLKCFMFNDFTRMIWRQTVNQILYMVTAVSSALLIWQGLIFVSGCESPIVVCSTSMGTVFNRGDLLLLTNYDEEPIRVGDIIIFNLTETWISTHRVIEVNKLDNSQFVTKGDDNQASRKNVDDGGVYAPGQLWLDRRDVVGKVKGVVPYIGMVNHVMGRDFLLQCAAIIWLVLRHNTHRESLRAPFNSYYINYIITAVELLVGCVVCLSCVY